MRYMTTDINLFYLPVIRISLIVTSVPDNPINQCTSMCNKISRYIAHSLSFAKPSPELPLLSAVAVFLGIVIVRFLPWIRTCVIGVGIGKVRSRNIIGTLRHTGRSLRLAPFRINTKDQSHPSNFVH